MSKLTRKSTIYVGEYGPITVSESGQLTYGGVIRYTRRLHRLSPEYVAVLYGEIARDEPVTGRHILRMEQTNSFFPRRPNRRWVLAKLLCVPPTLFALAESEASIPTDRDTSKKIDVPIPPRNALDVDEYYHQLRDYWVEGCSSAQLGETIEDIKVRIDRLHDIVLYVSTQQKPRITRLLCGYQVLLAGMAESEGYYKTAGKYFTNAITLAQEKAHRDLLVISLFRRQAFFDDIGKYQASLHDFERVTRQNYADSLLLGQAYSTAGKSQAAVTQTEDDRSTALRYFDEAEKRAGPAIMDNYLFFAAFDKERYFLDRATALMSSSDEKFRSPTKAQECLLCAERQRQIRGRSINLQRQVNSNLVQAKIYYDQEYNPVAATTAESVVRDLKECGMSMFLGTIEDLFQGLKVRVPHSLEVARLELALMKVKRPELFN